MAQRLAALLLSACLGLAACKGCGGPGSELPSSLAGCQALLPPELAITFGTDDFAALRQRLANDPSLGALRKTAMWQDLVADVDLLAPERLGQRLTGLTGAPAAELVGDAALAGLACGAASWQRADDSAEQPGRGRLAHLLVKHLDRSQAAAQKAADLWLQAAAKANAAPVAGGTLVELRPGASGLAYAVSGPWLLLGSPDIVAAGLQRAGEIRAGTLDPTPASTLGPGSLALSLDVSRLLKDIPPSEQPLALLPFVRLGLELAPASDKALLTLRAHTQPGWRIESAAPPAGLSYVSREARLALLASGWDMTAWYGALTQRYGDGQGPLAALGVDFAAGLAPHLSGELLYALHGVLAPARGAPAGEVFFDQVLGFGLRPGVKPSQVEATLRQLAVKALRGKLKRQELAELGATLLCVGRPKAPAGTDRCFALREGMLLVGYEASVRRSLRVAAGNEADLSDRPGLPAPLTAPGSGGLALLDLPGLTGDLQALARAHHGPHVRLVDVEQTLAPFLASLAGLRGVELTLAPEQGGLRGTLYRL